MSEQLSDLGIVGLGAMGRNLALNFADQGYAVAVYNRTAPAAEALAAGHPALTWCPDYAALAAALVRPRRVLIMVPAGEAVDQVLEQLLPCLEPGDAVADGGNTHFPDTVRRQRRAAEAGIAYLGVGVSGGAAGARRGPALMAGGSPEAWDAWREPFTAIAARNDDGMPCAGYFGGGGAGHYLKMVHNGIESAVMGIIAEVYWLLKFCNDFHDDKIAQLFRRWNAGMLSSYLLEISIVILEEHDSASGLPLVEMIRDVARSKGTGVQCCSSAMELGVGIPTIYESVSMRQLSEDAPMREYAAARWSGRPSGTPLALESVEAAFYSSTVMAYAQGFAMLHRAGAKYGWDFDFAELAGIWRAGCIIRAAMLRRIRNAYLSEPELPCFAFSGDFSRDLSASHGHWSRIIAQGTTAGLLLPCIASALSYFDLLRAEHLPANLLQAQRDYFGGHRFERTDRPRYESFHHDWPDFHP